MEPMGKKGQSQGGKQRQAPREMNGHTKGVCRAQYGKHRALNFKLSKSGQKVDVMRKEVQV